MTARSPHPFRTALETRDPEAIMGAMHPDITYHHPLVEVPVRGREQVMKIFALLASVVDDNELEVVDEFSGDRALALVIRFRVDGNPVDSVDHFQLDDDGWIHEILGAMRPFTSLRMLARRVAEPLGEVIAAQGSDDADRFQRSRLREAAQA